MTTTTSLDTDRSWRFKLLLLWNCIGVLLFASLTAPFTSELWNILDVSFFHFINRPLKHSTAMRTFWALTNHSIADWIEDLCVLGFYLAAIFQVKKGLRTRRLAEFIFCVLLIGCTILLVNRFLCHDLLRLRRHSPTLVIYDAVYLSDFLSWIQVKVNSNKSFPGDHATTALMFALSYAYLVRGKLGILAILYGLFLCLPRLAVGAHWLSDIVVGSGSITLFFLSWVFLTPLANRCIFQLEKLLKLITRQFQYHDLK